MSHIQKRSRVADESSMKSGKRRKLQNFVANTNSLVTDENLQWNEVAVSQRLGDAEGFSGLEEIDGVEVIKDKDRSHIQFHRRRPTIQTPPNLLASPKSLIEKELAQSAADVSDEEWTGIQDGEDTSNPTASSKRKQNAPDTRAGIQLVGNSRATRTSLDSNIAFDALENVGEAPETDVSEWSSLSISEDVLSSIASLGFATPTPIQASAIPKILQGHDVIGKAVTGSGKTLAYGIPIFDHWLQAHREGHTTSKSGSNNPTALILAPTRELAHQLAMHISDLTRACANRPKLAKVTGGLSIQKQLRQLADANFVVGTPGRLWEVMNESQELVSGLKQIKFLVLDEADRLLSDGHFKEIEEILDALDRKIIDDEDATTEQQAQVQSIRQTLVFSATFHQALQQKLMSKRKVTRDDQLKSRHSMEYLLKKLSFREKRPIFIDVNPSVQMAAALDEAILECGAMEKDLYLYYLLLKIPRTRVLVFSNSISSVKRLVSLLQNLRLPAVALHSSMPQKARLRSLERFTTQPTILVATDVAARGLDIKNIELILHYHVPRTADIYVHRSGRTARADKSGKSVMLCSPDEFSGVTRLIGKVHSSYQLESIQADRTILARLRPRLELSQKLTDARLAKEKAGTRDQWLRTAAEELGVDYDSDEFAAEAAKSSRGRGAGNSKKEKTAGARSKGEITEMQERLNDLLDQKINLGVSPRYLAGGNVDVDALLDGQSDSTFLARVSSM